MLVLKRKSYLVLLVVLAAAVVVAAWKNVRPEDLSGVLEEENRSVSIPNSIHQTKKQESLVGVWIPYMSLQADGTENGFKVCFDGFDCAVFYAEVLETE